jgi:hypothetical protein
MPPHSPGPATTATVLLHRGWIFFPYYHLIL